VKILLRLFEKVSPAFREGGKLRAFKPVYDAMENFFFAPSKTTLAAPHVRDPLDVKRFMSMVIVALVPCLIASFYFFGLRLIAMIMVSYIAGGTVEVIFAMVRKEDINEGFLVTGMLFPLILPPAMPLWMVGVGVAFGVFVGKELFGGTGRNIFNPALVGRCFLALAYPAAISSNWVTPGAGTTGRFLQYVDASNVEAITSATPLVLAKQGVLVELSHMFIGNVSGSVGETSAWRSFLAVYFCCLREWRTGEQLSVCSARRRCWLPYCIIPNRNSLLLLFGICVQAGCFLELSLWQPTLSAARLQMQVNGYME